MKTKTFLILSLLSTSFAASARAETSLVFHTVSHHFSTDRQLNGVNPGLGARVRQGSFALQAGVFRNSHDRRSLYALADWQPLTKTFGDSVVSAGLTVGTVNGYPWHDGRFVPVAGAVTNLRIRGGVDLRLRFVPAYRNVSAAMVSLEIGKTFRR